MGRKSRVLPPNPFRRFASSLEVIRLAAALGLCCLMEQGEVFTSLWSHQMLHKDPEAMYRVLTCGGVGSDHVSPQFFE